MRQKSRKAAIAALVVLMVLTTATGPVAAAGDLTVDLQTESSTTVGESVDVTGTVSVPDLTGSYEADVTVSLYVDGQQRTSQTVTLKDGETTSVGFSHTFQSEGSHTVTVEASTSFAGQSFGASASETINVEAKSETEEDTDSSSSSSTDTLSTTSIEGASFTVPDSLEDEVEDIRSTSTLTIPANAFVLATNDQLYIVFTTETPETGHATVTGKSLDQSVSADGLSYGVIVAESASFTTTGNPASVSDIASNPSEYQLEVVETTSKFKRASVAIDPDKGQGIEASSTAGVLTENTLSAESFVKDAVPNARSALIDTAQSSKKSSVTSLVGEAQGESVRTASGETIFWSASTTTTTSIVISPNSAAHIFLNEYKTPRNLDGTAGGPVLYTVDTSRDAKAVSSIDQIKQNADSLSGDVVTVEASVYGKTVSVQETIEHNTACGQTKAQVDKSCIDLASDVLVYTGGAWSGDKPESADDVLLVYGLSSAVQDSPKESFEGQYRLTGEVVSTSSIDPALPDGAALFIYDIEKTDGQTGLNGQAAAKKLVSQKAQQAITVAENHALDKSVQQVGVAGENTKIASVTADENMIITFDQNASGAATVSKVSIASATSESDVRVSATPTSLPDRVESPPEAPIQIMNITVEGLSDSEIEKAEVTMTIDKSKLDGASLSQIVVYRYHDGSWQSLTTSVKSTSESSVTVVADTPGFSYYAVGTSDTATETGTDEETNSQQTDTDTQNGTETTESEGSNETATGSKTTSRNVTTSAETPGMGILTAIVALAGVLAALSRRSA